MSVLCPKNQHHYVVRCLGCDCEHKEVVVDNWTHIFVPTHWVTGEPGDDHSPMIKALIEFMKEHGHDFIDYGEQLELNTGPEGVPESYGAICFVPREKKT